MKLRLRRRWARAMLLAAGVAPFAHAQRTPQPAQPPDGQPPVAQSPSDQVIVLEGDQAFAFALQVAIRSNDWQGALDVLDSRADLASRPDAKRLRAELYRMVGRERDAIALLEEHLTQQPDDALARFQLAEAHFAAERDQEATLAYRMSLAGNLDDLRKQIANARLAQIADRRVWRFWAGASVAPDSNVNSATDATRVDLFGLPFELDDAARRQSGVSLSLFGGVERRFRFSDDFALRASIIGSLTDTPGRQFDQMSLSARTGPEWRFGRDSFLSLQATTSQRWLGGDPYETRAGLLAEGDFSFDSSRWSGAVQADSIDDLINPARDGWSGTIDVNRTQYLSPSSLWRLGAALSHRESEAASESYDQLMVTGGMLMPAPFSALAYIEPYILSRDYEGASFAFGVEREDIEYGVSVRFSKRDWIIAGAFPFMSLSVSRNESNISLNDFSRERVEFGFTREF